MSIVDLLSSSSAKWCRSNPATPEAIRDLVSECGIELPSEYLEFLQFSDGAEGELGVQPGWFQLWPAEGIIPLNNGYKVDENVPGFFAIGSNGAGEMLAFDTRYEKPWPIVMIPFILMQVDKSKAIAPDFVSFINQMGREFAG